jgi:signal transduction histidine kinase
VLDDLQKMARGIHPAMLAKGGLGPALKTLARRSSVPVELGVRAVARLPGRAEVAAYYVVSEALTNAPSARTHPSSTSRRRRSEVPFGCGSVMMGPAGPTRSGAPVWSD